MAATPTPIVYSADDSDYNVVKSIVLNGDERRSKRRWERLQTQPEALRKRSILTKLLVIYLAFILYLYLANWLGYLNLVSLPLSNLPSGSLLPLVLLGVVAVTLFNSKRKSRKAPGNKSA